MAADPVQRRQRPSLTDFGEMLLDRPEGETWELIDGALIRGMVGALDRATSP